MNTGGERRGLWLRGLEALQCGTLGEAVECFLAEAQSCEETQSWARAAIAWRTAATTVSRLGDPARGVLLLRRAATASLAGAESSDDPRQMRDGFLEAARAFLTLGDIAQAKYSLDLAVSIESILADERSQLLLSRPESCASV